MAKLLEGYVDDGHGQPLAGLTATVTTVSGGLVVTSGPTDSDGRWLFHSLPDGDEYFVTVGDGHGRFVTRGPWSGEMREAWVRDSLVVGGLPVEVDPAADNGLAWTTAGLYVPPPPDTYTRTEADARYVNVPGDTMTGPLGLGAAGQPYAVRLVASNGHPTVPGWGDLALEASHVTTEGSFRADIGGGNYADLNSDGLVIEGDDYGSVTLRGVAGGQLYFGGGNAGFDYTSSPIGLYFSGAFAINGSLTVADKPVAVSPDASNALEWRANGLYSAPGSGGGGSFTQAQADLLYEPLDTMYTKAESDARYEPFDSAYTKAEADARYYGQAAADSRFVNVTGDTISGGMILTTGDHVSVFTHNAYAPYMLDSNAPGHKRIVWKRDAAQGFTVRNMSDSLDLLSVEHTYGNTTIAGSLTAGYTLNVTTGGANITGAVSVVGNININGTIVPSAVDHRAIVDTSAASPWLLYNHPASYARILWRRDQAKAFQVHDMDVNAYLLEVAQTSGNTLVRGTLDVGGALTTHNGDVGQPTTATLFFNQAKTKYIYQSGYDYQFVGGGLTVGGNSAITGTLGVTGAITAAAKGHRLGAAGGTAHTGALAQADANLLLYANAADNWAGVGTDGSGNIWFRTGLSGTPGSRLSIASDGTVNILGNVGFYGTAAVAKQVVSGARASNVALTNLLTALAALGLITNSTTT